MDFSEINREALTEDELRLLHDIEDTFYQVREIEETVGLNHQLNKCYFVFAFNLFLLRAIPEGFDMMTNIDPNYYSQQLTLDVEEAFEYLQEMEDLKNQVSDDKLQRKRYCQEQAELLDVAFGMLQTLQYFEFPGRDHFQQFIDDMVGRTYEVRKMPEISVVKDD